MITYYFWHKRLRIVNKLLKKENQIGLNLFDTKTNYKDTLIYIVWYLNRDRQIEQGNIKENIKESPHTYTLHLIHEKMSL